LCLWTSNRLNSVTGLDVGMIRLHQANDFRKKFEKDVGYLAGDAQSLPFMDEYFDLVVSAETLEHVPNMQKAFNEIVRVTKNSGHIAITLPNFINTTLLFSPVSFLLSSTAKKWNPQPPDFHRFSTFTIDDVFDRKDLKVLFKRGVGLVHFPTKNKRINSIEYKMSRPFNLLNFLCLNIGVIAQKVADGTE